MRDQCEGQTEDYLPQEFENQSITVILARLQLSAITLLCECIFNKIDVSSRYASIVMKEYIIIWLLKLKKKLKQFANKLYFS